MQKYICMPCGFIYDPMEGDPDSGISPGTPFEEIPEDWSCPDCGVSKSMFEPYNESDYRFDEDSDDMGF